MHRDGMEVCLIAGFFVDFAEGGLVPGFTAVATSLGKEPFVLCTVMDETYGLVWGRKVE